MTVKDQTITRPLSRRAITWRSILLGTAGVVLVCGLTPYNDYVVANTFLIGSHLPLVVVASLFILIVLVNGPLHRFAPRRALSSGELAVILVMMLVSCSLPSQGLMRAFIPMLTSPFYHGRSDPVFWNAFVALDLPEWLFPVTERSSPVIDYFYGRVPDGGPIPYGAWIVPLICWGIFIAAMLATLVALAIIVRPQWATNERLAFPLAQIQIALIQPPRQGRMLNDLFRSRLFWTGLLAVFTIQSFAALSIYLPQYFPAIPLTYDLKPILSEEPWRYLHEAVRCNTLYFTFVGVTFFIPARVAFSLWAIYLGIELTHMQLQMGQYQVPMPAWRDQHLGSGTALLLGVIWIGRHQWWKVIRQMFAGAGTDGNSCRAPALTVVTGVIVMIGWLMIVGVSWWMAMLIVVIIVMAHVLTTRVVAETGMPAFRATITAAQVYTNLPAGALSGRDIFFAGAGAMIGPFTARESAMNFSLHGLRAADGADPPVENRRGLIALMAWALTLGFVVAAASSLWCYYRHAVPLTSHATPTVINPDVLLEHSRDQLITPLANFSQGWFPPRTAHSPAAHFLIGLGITGTLQLGAIRFAAWPLMPVGYFTAMTFYMHRAWYSIMIGWLCKVLIVRFGGARLYLAAKPLFIGIIFGEALAAAAWLAINLLLAGMGHDYRPIILLPT